MGFFSFIKSAAKTIGNGLSSAGKWLGEKVAPVVHGISSTIAKYAPYASALAGGLGVPELGAGIAGVGRLAGKVADFTKGAQPPAQPPPSLNAAAKPYYPAGMNPAAAGMNPAAKPYNPK